jgi:hypothetical protein
LRTARSLGRGIGCSSTAGAEAPPSLRSNCSRERKIRRWAPHGAGVPDPDPTRLRVARRAPPSKFVHIRDIAAVLSLTRKPDGGHTRGHT